MKLKEVQCTFISIVIALGCSATVSDNSDGRQTSIPPSVFPTGGSTPPPAPDRYGTMDMGVDMMMDPRDTQSDLCTGVSDPQNTSELCQVFTRCIQSQCPLSSSAAVSNLCDQNVRTNFERVLLCQEGASINTCDELFSAYDMGCPPDSNTTPTTGSVFQCANGQQIPAHQKCDYFRDCADESDESENLNCQEPFLCKQTNQPIDPVQLCDGTPDCNDGSDEDQARCPSLFDCMDGTYLIYEAVCDLFVDCTSGYDELVCGLK